MKDEDTVMNFDEALMDAYENNNPTSDHAIGCRAVAKAQAEISFKAGMEEESRGGTNSLSYLKGVQEGGKIGIKEVVEAINKSGAHYCFTDTVSEWWEAQVKNWGL